MFWCGYLSSLCRRVNLLLLLLLISYSGTIEVQACNVFQKVYDSDGSDYGQNLHRTPDNGYIIGGVYSYEYSQDYHPFLLKLNSDGSVAWFRVYGEFSCDCVTFTQVGDDETFVLAGNFYSFDSYSQDIFLIKVDYSGNVLLSKTYEYGGDEVIRTFRKMPDGDYIVGGRWDKEVFLMKVGQDLEPVWTSIFGGGAPEVIYACQALSDSEFVAGGFTMSYGAGDADIVLFKMKMNGQLLWAEAIGSGYKEVITGDKGLSLTHDGGAILTGYTDRFDGSGKDVLLVKVDETGKSQWAKTYGGTGGELGFMAEETCGDSGFVIAGYSGSFSQQYNDGYLIKTDADGNLEWSKVYGGDNEEKMDCILQDTLNSYVFCGYTSSFDVQQAAIYVVKTDSVGNTGSDDRSVQTITRESELVVTPIEIEQLMFTIPNFISFPVSVASIDVADSSVIDMWTGIKSVNTDPIPESFNLSQNYPNPFNPVTTIEYSIPQTTRVSLRIYDVNGREIRTLLVNRITTAGNYRVNWNGNDNYGIPAASGTYFYQLKTAGFVKTLKMIYIK
jgi:hypothetical protein